MYTCEYACGLLIIARLANDKRNRLEWQFFFFLFLFFLSFLLPSSPMRPRESSVYTVPDHVVFAPRVHNSLFLHRREERFFCSNQPCFSFHGGGSCFLHLSLMKKFEYPFTERKFLYLFFLLNLLHANPLSFRRKNCFTLLELFELTDWE